MIELLAQYLHCLCWVLRAQSKTAMREHQSCIGMVHATCTVATTSVLTLEHHLTYVFRSMTSTTSLTGWQSSKAAARGSKLRPKVSDGARM